MANVKLQWDAGAVEEGWTAVRVYELVGVNYTKVGEVVGTATELTLLNVVPGRHVYVARSFGIWGESGDSNQAITPNPNQPPKNLRWSIVVTLP
jgi:hypothetical protein